MILAGLYLMPFAAIAFIWFIVALRMWMARHGRPEHALFSNVQLVSGIAFVWLGFIVGTFLLLAAVLDAVFVVVFPAWMLVLCGLLLVRARRITGLTPPAQEP